MPKREDDYMAAQRDRIASAVFDLIVKTGLHETTVRLICQEAKVSMGAFYVHFSSKEEAIDAALLLNTKRATIPPLPETWSEFEEHLMTSSHWDSPEWMNLLRLSFEITAMAVTAKGDWQAPDITYQTGLKYIKSILSKFVETGEIAPAEDLDQIARHIVFFTNGAIQMAVLVPEFRNTKYLEEMLVAVRKIVGRAP